ncbi:MAG: heparinase II/III-family protein, partial [Phycisphaerae bacterium]|nr:heparinase II/III-family protein [Phycisphaerae bacterium]
NTLMLAAMNSALGKDFGLSKAEGFDNAGKFRIHTIRPNGLFFNYGDCALKGGISPVMFWMARKFNRPEYAWFERQRIRQVFAKDNVGKGGNYKIRSHYPSRLYAMEIAWFDERGKTGKDNQWPLDANFTGKKLAVVTMRSAWGGRQPLYVGFKGGHNVQGHGHMDMGTFILDSDGVGWAIDLGADSYALPGFGDFSEGGQRCKYYRFGSKSHNTLVIGGKLQRAKNSICRMIDFVSTPDHAHAVLDMSNAYRGQAKKVLRGVAMLDRSRVLVQDEITCLNNDEIRWGMVTPADRIKLDGARAILMKDGKTLRAEILSPANARFEIVSTAPPTKIERPNPGTSMLVIFVKPGGKKNVRLAVLFTPVGKGWKKLQPPELRSLSEWKLKEEK